MTFKQCHLGVTHNTALPAALWELSYSAGLCLVLLIPEEQLQGPGLTLH